MNCNNCVHDKICEKHNRLVQIDAHTWDEYGVLDDVEKFCEHFKNKADFVEVPCRCKECKHRISYNDWDRNEQTSYVAHECRLNRRDLGVDGFCSCGERVNYESTKND